MALACQVFFDARDREIGNRQPRRRHLNLVSPGFLYGARLYRARRWWIRWQLEEPVTSTQSFARSAVEG